MIKKELKGLLGGIGAYASSHIYQMVLDYTRPKLLDSDFPNLIIYNLPCSFLNQENYENSGTIEEINHGIKVLNQAGTKKIYIGCNSIHSFIDKLDSKNVIDWTKDFINTSPSNNIMILGSKHTVNSNFYEPLLRKEQNIHYPTIKEQETINNLIVLAIQNKITKTEIDKFQGLLSKYNKFTIAICCTELSIIYFKLNHKYPNVIDSCDFIAKEIIL